MADPHAAPSVEPRGELLYLAVIQPHGNRGALLDVQLREPLASARGGGQDLFGEGSIEHGGRILAEAQAPAAADVPGSPYPSDGVARN